jgi:hypothetical protein
MRERVALAGIFSPNAIADVVPGSAPRTRKKEFEFELLFQSVIPLVVAGACFAT